jgi:hypothetical protein
MSKPKTTQAQEPKQASVKIDENQDAALDEALDESFPASDPIAISVDHEPAATHGKPSR